MNPSKIVSADQWILARKRLLAKEKELTRRQDELAEERRALPWVLVEKSYVFQGPTGRLTLSDLFAEKSQLAVYHFMLGPGWKEGCPSCSLLADHVDGALPHLAARDVTFAAVSRAPHAEIAAFKQRMGWHFAWVSSNENDFNRDYHVHFSKEEVASGACEYNYGQDGFRNQEAPGMSVFFKDETGAIFHTYSEYARGLEELLGTYHVLDRVPKGRNESGLPWPMAWVRHHDKYGTSAA